MKSFFYAVLLCASIPAFAGEKNCTWERSNSGSGSSGDTFKAEVAEHKLVVKDLSAGSSAWEGAFKRKSADVVNGKDGNTYMDFAGDGGDGCSEVLVDENLLKARGKGNIKFRCRGEGFGEDIFSCEN